MFQRIKSGVARVVRAAKPVVPVVAVGGVVLVAQSLGLCQTEPASIDSVVTAGATAMQGNLLTVGTGVVGVAAVGGGIAYGIKWLYRLAHS